jgi:hypothetical protein
MLTTPHALAGAAIGSLLPNSIVGAVLGFGLGFCVHFVLDSTPHWERLFVSGNHTELSKKGYTKRDKAVYVQVVIDGLVGLTGLYFATKHNGGGDLRLSSAVLWGGIGGVLPDVLDNIHPISRRLHGVWLFKTIEKLHKNYHINYEAQRRLPHYTGLLTQILVVALSLAALR